MKKIIMLLLGMFMVMNVSSQTFYSPNQQFIKDAIAGEFFVVEQSFQLKDNVNNQIFGRNNRSEFGQTRSLAFKTTGGYYLLDKAVHPWEYDSNYNRYRSTHQGVLYRSYIFRCTDSIGSRQRVEINNIQKTSLHDIYICCDSLLFSGVGLQNSFNNIGNNEGWLVWITSKSPIEKADTATAISYLIYKKNMEMKSDTIVYALTNPSTSDYVWGGIYITPTITKIGQITFLLSGILFQREEKWYICKIPLSPLQQELISEEREGELVLTPVMDQENLKRKNKKVKKNRNDDQ